MMLIISVKIAGGQSAIDTLINPMCAYGRLIKENCKELKGVQYSSDLGWIDPGFGQKPSELGQV